jgi:hypothetical protein
VALGEVRLADPYYMTRRAPWRELVEESLWAASRELFVGGDDIQQRVDACIDARLPCRVPGATIADSRRAACLGCWAAGAAALKLARAVRRES